MIDCAIGPARTLKIILSQMLLALALISGSIAHAANSSTCTNLGPGEMVPWTCFQTAVALVARRQTATGTTVTICSGVALDRTHVVTAAHCVETARDWNSDLDVHADAKLVTTNKPVSIAPLGAMTINPHYNHDESNFVGDMGYLELKSPLPEEWFYPETTSLAAEAALPKEIIRVGFGGRRSTVGPGKENRRTKVIAKPLGIAGKSPDSSVLMTEDYHAVPGDSGGPLYILTTNPDGTQKLKVIGTHSTLTRSLHRAYAPLFP